MKLFKSGRVPALLAAAVGFAWLGAASLHAVPLDLTTAGSAGWNNGAYFATTEIQPTGTGVIDPFLREQGNGTETGLNSNDTQANLLLDTKGGTWTHDLTLGSLGTVTMNGVTYYKFLLDINQTSSSPLLSLDTFTLYTSPNSITDGNPDSVAAVIGAGGVQRYSLADPVYMNYNLNPGSGAGDVFIYVPTSDFAGAMGSNFLYANAVFGATGGDYKANDGFEEFAALTGASSVPDGGTTVILIGAGILMLSLVRRLVRT